MTTYTRHFDLLTGWNGWQAQDDTAEITDCDDIKGWLDEIDAEDFPTVSEPAESSTATAAAYGDLDIAQLINEQKARMGLSTIEIAMVNLSNCRERNGRDVAYYETRLDEEILKASRAQ